MTDPTIEEIGGLVRGLRLVADRVNEMDERTARHATANVKAEELAVFRVLGASGPMRMRQLANALRISAPRASGMISRLEMRQLVKRQHDDGDRRAVNVWLTAKGQNILKQSESDERQLCEELLSACPAEDRALVVKVFTQLAQEIQPH